MTKAGEKILLLIGQIDELQEENSILKLEIDVLDDVAADLKTENKRCRGVITELEVQAIDYRKALEMIEMSNQDVNDLEKENKLLREALKELISEMYLQLDCNLRPKYDPVHKAREALNK